jgi:hypothetical protein
VGTAPFASVHPAVGIVLVLVIVLVLGALGVLCRESPDYPAVILFG